MAEAPTWNTGAAIYITWSAPSFTSTFAVVSLTFDLPLLSSMPEEVSES